MMYWNEILGGLGKEWMHFAWGKDMNHWGTRKTVVANFHVDAPNDSHFLLLMPLCSSLLHWITLSSKINSSLGKCRLELLRLDPKSHCHFHLVSIGSVALGGASGHVMKTLEQVNIEGHVGRNEGFPPTTIINLSAMWDIFEKDTPNPVNPSDDLNMPTFFPTLWGTLSQTCTAKPFLNPRSYMRYAFLLF